MSHLFHTVGSLLAKRRPTFALLALLTLILTPALQADTFSEGTKAYQNGKYESALKDFDAAISEGETAATRHNLALTYFQLKQPADAVWQLERAVMLDPLNKEYRTKLGALRQQLGLFANEPKWFEIGAQTLTPQIWILLATVAFWLLFALLLPKICGTRTGIGVKTTCWLAAVILLLALPAIWTQSRILNTGIIVSEQAAALHSAPAGGAPQNGTASPGERARILDRHNNFYQVETESGITGWLSNDDFKPLG